MTKDSMTRVPGAGSRGILIALGAVALTIGGWVTFSTWADIEAVGESVFDALWALPLAIVIHLVQLFLSSNAWRGIFTEPRPHLLTYFRLRLIREGVDSLFPVAQMGGEVIAARILAQRDIPASQAGASVIVDVTLEVLAQAAFVVIGIAVLTIISGDDRSLEWIGTMATALLAGGSFVLAQRLGALRVLEIVVERIAGQFPALAGKSLAGLHDAAQAFYRQKAALFRSFLFHLASWCLGALETWIILHALGLPADIPQALVVESLGMAARSAGFAIPGALAVQEGGFVLAVLSVGLPDSAGLALSLVKRAREVLVGIAGVALLRVGGSAR
jgi:putative membrane protein